MKFYKINNSVKVSFIITQAMLVYSSAFRQVIVDFDKFDNAFIHVWNDPSEGLSKSFDSMKEAFNKAKENYK